MKLTVQQLATATGAPTAKATAWLAHIQETIDTFQINTPARAAAFLAQIGHESGYLLYNKEIWGPTAAQLRYEGRKDLGNTRPGDGSRYRGRGLVQMTGRANYAKTRDELRKNFPDAPDFEATPEKLEEPKWAALSAGLYWHVKNLNALADAGKFELVTRRINGGLNGQADRLRLHALAKKTFGLV